MESNASVVKGNRPLRIFASFMVILILVAHFLGQIDLTENWIFWIALAMAANAIQASFTGFCPMFKNARGECVACGVTCCAPEEQTKAAAKSDCCGSSDCCSDTSSVDKKSSSCCDSSSDCCSDSSAKGSSCCDSSSDCCSDSSSSDKKASCCGSTCCDSDAVNIKVLGSGCKNCDQTARLIEKVAEKLQLKICLCKVEEMPEIASYGVMSTPGVVINEKVVHSGSVPTEAMIEEWFKQL
ncbi:MTH895/ArsE family thioredoxin-like protein [Thiomicrorhabdus heinhorstiae]|uniref:MTH895/ArsE family thioredoxin-like protein n=1 Tax=Thiomicrorhabdus heinhorstiae TaxID=2748010 RepID=UPI001E2863A2|nr:MTH895/ArsE family thioredoxin-like protein [Thiomicrorhabdus heinhorstiae]